MGEMITKVLGGFFCAILFTSMFTGCGPAEKKPQPKLVLPGPPEEPKLLYINSYRGESDFSESSAIDVLIGEAKTDVVKNLNKPYGAGGKNGRIYASDTILGVVFAIDPVKKKVSFIGDGNPGKLGLPVSMAFDKNDNIYVADAKIKTVYKYDVNGTFKATYGSREVFYRPTGLALNEELGLLYVVDTEAHNIKVFSASEGKQLFTFGKRGGEDGEFNYPTNIAIDRRNGNLVVVDTQNFRIQKFDKDGKFLSKFGQVGDKPGMFARPKGVGVDSDGHIYVADAAFDNMQIFDSNGTLLFFFGRTGGEPGMFNMPSGVYMDEEDKLYIAEGFSGRVQVFQYISDKWKRANIQEYQKLKE